MTCYWSKEFCGILLVEERHLQIFADGHKVGSVLSEPFRIYLEMLENY
jgi:hypothetical protein